MTNMTSVVTATRPLVIGSKGLARSLAHSLARSLAAVARCDAVARVRALRVLAHRKARARAHEPTNSVRTHSVARRAPAPTSYVSRSVCAIAGIVGAAAAAVAAVATEAVTTTTTTSRVATEATANTDAESAHENSRMRASPWRRLLPQIIELRRRRRHYNCAADSGRRTCCAPTQPFGFDQHAAAAAAASALRRRRRRRCLRR